MFPSTCEVCLDSVHRGVACSAPPKNGSEEASTDLEARHTLCDDCFIKHVHALPDARLRETLFRIPCPADGWHGGVFSIEDVARAYVRSGDARSLAHYLERSLPKARTNGLSFDRETRIEALTNALYAAISLRCPNCETIVDPAPDGCRAIECASCGSYFCWVKQSSLHCPDVQNEPLQLAPFPSIHPCPIALLPGVFQGRVV